MARDRQRAKQRKARRDKQPGANADGPVREDLPGELEHASGEVDEFDAKLVADAQGQAADDGAADTAAGDGVVDHPEGLSDEEFAELEDRVDDIEETFESGDQGAIEEAEGELEQDIAERKRGRAVAAKGASPGAPTKKGGFRFVAFLRASWAELQRVQWPDRHQVGQATAVVLGFVVVAGLYLGLADAAAKKIVDFII